MNGEQILRSALFSGALFVCPRSSPVLLTAIEEEICRFLKRSEPTAIPRLGIPQLPLGRKTLARDPVRTAVASKQFREVALLGPDRSGCRMGLHAYHASLFEESVRTGPTADKDGASADGGRTVALICFTRGGASRR